MNNIDDQNIKSVKFMYKYLEKTLFSFLLLYDIFKKFCDTILNLQNELECCSRVDQFVDAYNKINLFIYKKIKDVLLMLFNKNRSGEMFIIKPISNNKYYHNLKFTYFIDNDILTKSLGNIISISINKTDNKFIFSRGNKNFTFILFNLNLPMTRNKLKEQIEICLLTIKDIINWIYSDIKFIKISIKLLTNIIFDIMNMSNILKNSKSWIKILENIKKTIKQINDL